MAHKGLDGFLGTDEKKVVDLDWLNIDPCEYDNMPFDDTPEYIALPKLEQAWNHDNERSNFNLVPNSDLDFNYKTPDLNRLNNQKMDDVHKLLDFTKKQMMAGVKGEKLSKVIEDRANPQIIKEAISHLKKLASEQGLLGYVYIDPNVFDKCEEGADFVRKRAKTAKYVLSMDKCAGCVFNKGGRCDVYKKHLASEINYDEELFRFYSKHFTNVTGKEVKISSKEDLKIAFTKEDKKEVKVAEYKPKISKDEKEDKTLKQKDEEYKKQLKSLQDELMKLKFSKVAKNLGILLSKGYDNKILKDHVNTKFSSKELEENKKAVCFILSKRGSLGKVYLDSDLLPIDVCNRKQAQDFFENHAKDVKYIVSNCGCSTCTCKQIPNKIIVKSVEDIPEKAWDNAFNAYPENIKSKLSSIYKEDKEKALRLAYLQDSKINLKTPTNIESYELKRNVDANEYTPNLEKDVYFTSKKISAALEKGFPLSKIVKTGKSLGVGDSDIKAKIIEAFENHVNSVNKHQLDIGIDVPEKVKITTSGKDIALDLQRPLSEVHEISYDSSNAPTDSMVSDLGLRESSLDTSTAENKYEDIEINGLDQFTID